MKKLVLVKLGGAVITNKSKSESVRVGILSRLINEIARAKSEAKMQLLLGNGSGSFAHMPAKKYQTMEGFIDSNSRLGMALTQDSAARLNRIVVSECLRVGLPAVTLAPSNVFMTDRRIVQEAPLTILQEYLSKDLIPVVYGDVLVDKTQGCTIWSTDTVFSHIVQTLRQKGWQIDQIIHVTEASGVWKNEKKQNYESITPQMADEVQRTMIDVEGVDVTGGMWHKITEALSLTQFGVTTRIISGLEEDALYRTLTGDTSIGTTIRV